VAFVKVALAALLVLAAGTASAASQPASRLVDRTLLCKTYGAGYPDPLRILAVVAAPGFAQATNGPASTPQGVVAQIATGVNGGDQVVLSRVACGRTSRRIPLSAKGLQSGATPFGNKWRCPVPASVLIRLRAVFRNPVTLVPAPDARHLSIAKGTIREGSLAVAIKSKVPIAFAFLEKRSGKASIFVARPRCQRVKY
jgi:hypothetical protein